METLRTDVAIIGGGLGAVAAALAVARSGCRCVLTEETHWIGGQLTNQAVRHSHALIRSTIERHRPDLRRARILLLQVVHDRTRGTQRAGATSTRCAR